MFKPKTDNIDILRGFSMREFEMSESQASLKWRRKVNAEGYTRTCTVIDNSTEILLLDSLCVSVEISFFWICKGKNYFIKARIFGFDRDVIISIWNLKGGLLSNWVLVHVCLHNCQIDTDALYLCYMSVLSWFAVFFFLYLSKRTIWYPKCHDLMISISKVDFYNIKQCICRVYFCLPVLKLCFLFQLLRKPLLFKYWSISIWIWSVSVHFYLLLNIILSFCFVFKHSNAYFLNLILT